MRKPSTIRLTKISVVVITVVFLCKMAITLRTISWSAKIVTEYTHEEMVIRDVNFTFVNPSLVPRLPSQEIFLIVLVSSAPGSDYQIARNAIRTTWGTSDECANTPDVSRQELCRWKVVYLVGKSYNESLDSKIIEEARNFNDILVGNFHDTYINLVIKLFMGFSWATKINCRFVLKADDDIYVHLPKLISWLQQAPSRLYAGHVHKNVGVSRDPHARNPLPHGASFNEKYYPSYCLGAFYILSRNIIPDILKAVNRWRPWPIEDTYIGVLARDIGVSPVDIYGFVLAERASRNLPYFDECHWASTIALGHRLTPSHLQLIYDKFESLSSFNSSTCPSDTCLYDTGCFFLHFIYILLFITVPFSLYVWVRKQRLKLNTQWFSAPQKQ